MQEISNTQDSPRIGQSAAHSSLKLTEDDHHDLKTQSIQSISDLVYLIGTGKATECKHRDSLKRFSLNLSLKKVFNSEQIYKK